MYWPPIYSLIISRHSPSALRPWPKIFYRDTGDGAPQRHLADGHTHCPRTGRKLGHRAIDQPVSTVIFLGV